MKIFVTFILSFLFCVATASAQSNGSNENTAAKRHFQAGLKLIEVEDFGGAVAAFEISWSLRQNKNVLFNLAFCYRAVHRYAESIESFQKLLSEYKNELSDEMRQTAEQNLLALRELVGRLQVDVAQPGATIQIDENRQITSPQSEPVVVGPGKHKIIVSLDGYKTAVMEVRIVPNEDKKLEIALAPTATEKAHFEATPSDTGVGPLLVSGIGVGAIGLGMAVVGTVLLVKSNDYLDEMDQYQSSDPAAFDDANSDYQRNRKGAIVSFSVAGALIAASAVMIVVDRKKAKHKEARTVAFKPTAGGLTMTF